MKDNVEDNLHGDWIVVQQKKSQPTNGKDPSTKGNINTGANRCGKFLKSIYDEDYSRKKMPTRKSNQAVIPLIMAHIRIGHVIRKTGI